ncbi:hypothetical protein FE257_006113 [Aspergillus nanangensis]|uniref:Uncharacterized protein n=1 Tax=Aspergillus nanangensis TaxID=2582783 RepID=A0AAD4GUY3_ASPNN|nr:hypothetical protein FE257_006113 [Aspergillus nanangensis]
MDEFAQTRGADDLFDDEIVPVPAEEQPKPEIQVEEQPPIATVVDTEATPARVETPSRGERRGRGRGKGRGGRRGSQNSGQRRAEGAGAGAARAKSADSSAQPESQDPIEETTRSVSDAATEQEGKPEIPTEPKAAAAAAAAEAQRVPAVRGDRSATGGIKKPKLTEEQLSQRIAAAKENAAKKAAAHARAEADQASFLEREKVAETKRREERANRRVMDSERERNRQRKLKALTGREWDADKDEESFSQQGGKGQFRRGMHGGVSGYTRRDFGDSQAGEEASSSSSPVNNPRGRGRGGRGGRGRGRGPRGGDPSTFDGTSGQPASTEAKSAPTPVIDNESDFPALPGGQKEEKKKDNPTESVSPPDASKLETSLSPVSAPGATWADQVEDA